MNCPFTSTQLGRMMITAGGNAEAARRAKIDGKRIQISSFVARSMVAALGGVPSSASLASASQQASTGDANLNAIAAVIGGSSVFGGPGVGPVGNSWHHRDPVHRQQPDAAQPVVEPLRQDRRRRPRHRRHPRQPRGTEPGVPGPADRRNCGRPRYPACQSGGSCARRRHRWRPGPGGPDARPRREDRSPLDPRGSWRLARPWIGRHHRYVIDRGRHPGREGADPCRFETRRSGLCPFYQAAGSRNTASASARSCPAGS